MVKNILIISLRGLGDQIMFLPALEKIKKTYPDSIVTFIVEPRSKAIIELSSLIDNIILFDNNAKNKYLELAGLLSRVAKNKYDLVISTFPSLAVAAILMIAKFRGTQKLYGLDVRKSIANKFYTKIVPYNTDQSMPEKFYNLIRDEASGELNLPEVDISADSIKWAEKSLGVKEKQIIAIHPGCSMDSRKQNTIKEWSGENWTELIKMMLNSGKYKVLLTGGPDDLETIEFIRKNLIDVNTENLMDLYGKTRSLSDFAALVKMSDILICLDSAPMHVAVGTKTKVLAFFGPTDEKIYLPYNKPEFSAITKSGLQCRPCLWKDRDTTCETLDCLDIKPEDVLQLIQDKLG